MSYKTTFELTVLSALIWMANPAPAQTDHQNEIRIELQGEGSVAGDLSVQLIDANGHTDIGGGFSQNSGEFTFRGIQEGDYTARVVDGSGRVVTEQMIHISSATPMIRMDVPSQMQKQLSPAGNVVSARQLQNPPSNKALKAFAQAQKYSAAGDHAKAAESLEDAVRLSPEFGEAHTNLGAQYLHLGRFQEAADQEQRAIEIGPPNVSSLIDCALAHWALRQHAEALHYAEEALNLDRDSYTGHYIAGSILVLKPETRADGMRHLEIAAKRIPAAGQELTKITAAMQQSPAQDPR